MMMIVPYDFSPVDRMKSWLLRIDSSRFEAAKAARHENDLWFANSGGNVIPDPAGELVVLADTPASGFLNGYVGNARIEPPDLSYSANDWLRLPEWPLNFAPFIIANFWDSARVELGESIRTNHPSGASATGKMREMELRRAYDCNTSKGISVYRDFADLIDRLRARINAGIESREITRLDVKGTAHIDAASAILYMQGKVACAVSPVNLPVQPVPINTRKSKLSDAQIADLVKTERSNGHHDFLARVAARPDVGLGTRQLGNIVAKQKKLEPANWLK